MHTQLFTLFGYSSGELAAIATTNAIYLGLTFIPPVLWLLFYLREDAHPEPKRFLLLTFLGGMGAALLAVVVEVFVLGNQAGVLSLQTETVTHMLVVFGAIGLIEEYVKYLPVKFLMLRRPDFDEPIDAMIYMMTAALGFAAMENGLFLLPVFHQNAAAGFEIATNRFLGANLLHALSSAIVGFFLARAWFHPRRAHFIAIGVVLAALLHTGFNYLILEQDAFGQATFYLVLLLLCMTIMVLVDFERLKKSSEPV
ncbi:MAG: PrsW family intramembrane metalloprotease [Candidatus Sungbacteria bacterium]|nr:PrsW family intramembrane metalloprotease [Candidatus Sungbacteria bacterium]